MKNLLSLMIAVFVAFEEISGQNTTDSGMTTTSMETTQIYPDTTQLNTTDSGLDDVCDDDDEYQWILRVTFRLQLLIDPDITENRALILNSLKQSFFRTILQTIMDWFDYDFCFDLNDDELLISEYAANTNRRLLQTEYSIDAGFEYNDELQTIFFGNDTLFDIDEFGIIFGDELIDILTEQNILNENTTDIAITVFEPKEDTESESDHKVEGSLINAVVIMAIIDVLIFIFCTIYVVKNTRTRADEEGDIDWKEANKKYKIPYWIGCVEILDSLIHWIFAIIVITLPSYLGWILFCLLLAAEFVLYTRYVLYKQLILYQVPKLRNDTKISDTELKEGIIARRTDIGILGIALGAVQDLPVIIIVIIVGENFGYNAIEVIALIVALISIFMKVGLLGNAMFSSTENGPIVNGMNGNKDEKATKEAIELAEDKNEEKETLKSTNDVEEEEKEKGNGGKDGDDTVAGDDKTEEEKGGNKENGDKKDEDVDGDDGDKKTEEEKPINTENKDKNEEYQE